MSRGFSLIEAVFATMLVAVLVVASLNATGHIGRSRGAAMDSARAHGLAHSLLNEVVAKLYEDADEAGSFGREPSDTPGRAGFDDVDDYHEFDDVPPSTPTGSAIPGASAFSRRVTVSYFEHSVGVLGGKETTACGKLIRVTVYRGGKLLADVSAVRTPGLDAVER